ncbi:MAG: hypothetical protein K6G83_14455, partial [Lachnospiraceae bacterium]|nr:hypothetical protein [Lachnospiraceae bacterium]
IASYYSDADIYTVRFYNNQVILIGEIERNPTVDPTQWIVNATDDDIPDSVKTLNSNPNLDRWIPYNFPFPLKEKSISLYAQMKVNPTGTPAPTPTTTPTPTPTATPTTTPSSSGSSSSSSSSKPNSSSSSSKSSSSSHSSSNVNSSTVPVVVSGAVSGYAPAGYAGTVTGTGTTGGGTKANGNTNVISTTPGISDVGKMSATVNGSSDSYVLKITETDEANRMAAQALTNEFGDLNNIRYLPFDISLYDSTGTNKISPIPEGTSVSVTMPIPDDLAIYGGNAKVACTENGTLQKIDPRFTVINGVPCMNYTCTHLSPYVVYVDIANLGDPSMMDTTPKTGDMIHPKWFLVIGLMAASIFLFLKRDKGERVATA